MAAAEETMRVRLAVRDYYNQFSQGLNFDELTGQLRRLKRSVEYSKRRQHVAPIASGDLKTLKQTLASLEQRIYNSDNNAIEFINSNDISEYEEVIISTVGYSDDMRGNIVLPEFKTNYLPAEENVQNVLDWSKNKGLLTKDIKAKDVVSEVGIK